jgi:hypothetical protein
MSNIDNFIPEIWEAELETEFHANQIVIPTVRQEFTGIFGAGNKVKITGAVDVAIGDYAAASRTLTTQNLSDDGIDLDIDQEKYFSFYVDSIDEVQAAGSFDAYTTSAGEAMAEDAESFLLGKMLSQSWTLNVTGATPLTIDSYDDAKTAALKTMTFLNNKKIPASNRYLAVNPAFAEYLISGLSDAALAGGGEELRNGQIARIWGFTVLQTPLLGDQSKPTCVGYHERSVGFVSQIQSLRSLPAQTKIATQVDGLNVYGGRVLRQQAIGSFVSGGVSQNAFSSFLS